MREIVFGLTAAMVAALAACGGSSGGAGGGGAGGGGGGGAGGGAVVAVMKACSSPTPAFNEADQPDVLETLQGKNGTFTDECTSDGQLIEYGCEIVPDNGPYHEPMMTGNVVPTTIDCNGKCKNGVCPAQ